MTPFGDACRSPRACCAFSTVPQLGVGFVTEVMGLSELTDEI